MGNGDRGLAGTAPTGAELRPLGEAGGIERQQAPLQHPSQLTAMNPYITGSPSLSFPIRKVGITTLPFQSCFLEGEGKVPYTMLSAR